MPIVDYNRIYHVQSRERKPVLNPVNVPDAAGAFIRAGVPVRAVDALVTNFHLPGSTLLMLISAMMGRERALAAYEEAVRERYRFFSFGDAMLILTNQSDSTKP